MSRTIIVGLAVIVVAVLSFLVIGAFSAGNVEDMAEGQGQFEVEGEAVEEAEAPVPSAISDPAEDVQDEAKNNDDDPLEQQQENAAQNAEAPMAEPVTSDSESPDETDTADVPAVVTDEDAGAEGAVEEALVPTEDADAEETDATASASNETAPVSAEAADAADDAAPTGDDAATDEADAAAGGVDTEALAALLTPETFDAEAVMAIVEESDLDQVEKDALMTALEQAADEPQFVDAAILSTKRRFDID